MVYSTWPFHFINGALAVISLPFLAIGIVLICDDVKYERLVDYSSGIHGPCLTAAGCGFLVAAAFGIWAALKKNRCMFFTYAIIVPVIVILHIVFGFRALKVVFQSTQNSEMEDEIKKCVGKVFKKYRNDPDSFLKTIKDVQKDIGCCGLDGPKWYSRPDNENATSAEQYCTDSYKDGCSVVIKRTVLRNLFIVGQMALFSYLIEILMAGGAIYCLHEIRKADDTANPG